MSSDRANRSTRGFTIIELLVYMAIAGVVMTTIMLLFKASGRTYDKAAQSYILTQQALAGYRALQTDLRETSLGSIVLEEDGISMISARSLDDPGRFLISRFGVPEWTGYIRYRFQPEGDKKNHYCLSRELIGAKTPPVLPLPLESGPDDDVKLQRVVINGLLPPGKAVSLKKNGYEMTDSKDSPGGAQFSFLRKDSSGDLQPSQTHPCDGDPAGNTGMVRVELKFFGYSQETGHLDYAEVGLTVTPRN